MPVPLLPDDRGGVVYIRRPPFLSFKFRKFYNALSGEEVEL